MLRLRGLALGLVLGVAGTAFADSAPPFIPGDCDYDDVVDANDWWALPEDLAGPLDGLPVVGCCHDLDGDGDVDLADVAALQRAFASAPLLSVPVGDDADDGTEVYGAAWCDDGILPGCNVVGTAWGSDLNMGLRFAVPDLNPGEQLAFARLVLPVTGYGWVDTEVRLRIVGIDEDSPDGFAAGPPGQRPKTPEAVSWVVAKNWPEEAGLFDCFPLYRTTPDIAPVINAVLRRPGWGSGPAGRMLALVIENARSDDGNFLVLQDYRVVTGTCAQVIAPRLELYRTVNAAIVAKELLTRPTDQSVTISTLALVDLETYFEYGEQSGRYTDRSSITITPAGTPLQVVLDGLRADMRYYYRMRYRRPGEATFAAGREHTFVTQRPRGAAFTFTVQSDSHLFYEQRSARTIALYQQVLARIARERPDFHFDLGDTFNCESGMVRADKDTFHFVLADVLDAQEAFDRHLEQRRFLGLVCHSSPYFLAIGNHEAEQGWRRDGTADNLAVWAALARKQLYPLPRADGFYAADVQTTPQVGLHEGYYAWEWGDALFIVLDPFWYTLRAPHSHAGAPASGDNWDWTLGDKQYNWLRDVLHGSTANWKFVFLHHLTGGVDTYGRGGIEAASHALGGCGSFEWGGENLDGTWGFAARRPGWGLPTHQLLVANGVRVVFHGHDHVFVKQALDGIVYQECPQIADPTYGPGCVLDGHYTHGDVVDNSGYLRVTVMPTQVKVQYIRAYLPGEGPDGEVAYEYSLNH